MTIKNMLVPTDFSEPSVVAVNVAESLAVQLSASLTRVHAVEPLTVPPEWQGLLEESNEKRLGAARTNLNAVAAEFCQGSLRIPRIVMLGRPADVISSIVRDHRMQLIVMGLTSDRGIFAPRPGSIAYRVLCSTPVPVLVVPTPDN